MTLPPDDDELVRFLRNHSPTPHPPAPDLEDRILAVLPSIPQETAPTHLQPLPKRRSRPWLIPSAIAASLLAGVISYRSLAPANQPSPAEIAALEDFIETSWRTAFNGTNDEETFLFNDDS
jgi:hypothetical protein